MSATTGRQRSFLLGALSIFGLDRVRLIDNDTVDYTADLEGIHPFSSDAEAIRHDITNIGRDIQNAITKYDKETRQRLSSE